MPEGSEQDVSGADTLNGFKDVLNEQTGAFHSLSISIQDLINKLTEIPQPSEVDRVTDGELEQDMQPKKSEDCR